MTFGDVVGDLVGLDAQTAVIDSRQGLVEVPLDRIAVARLAPPSTADELELERIVAAGWRAEHTAELGGWLLRASDGFTGRANSVLPLKAPGMPVDAALAEVSSWYAEHGLPPKFQVPTEARRLLDAELGERGWEPSPDVHVMVARLDVLPAAAPQHSVSVDVAPDESWLRRFRDGVGLRPAARALLTRHDHAAFAAVRDADGTAIAIGRATLDDGWLGVTAVEVAPEHRRTGLATSVMRALWQWGRTEGALRTHLEVSSDNEAAVTFYKRLGYWVHHDYRYRTAPST
ncbi:MAG TPA: GNAT family N-acetyltransferase [Jatrophihabitans sp.]|nr:GNAT family N-acetyltransferase [Jatrophihabitans sp.]